MYEYTADRFYYSYQGTPLSRSEKSKFNRTGLGLIVQSYIQLFCYFTPSSFFPISLFSSRNNYQHYYHLERKRKKCERNRKRRRFNQRRRHNFNFSNLAIPFKEHHCTSLQCKKKTEFNCIKFGLNVQRKLPKIQSYFQLHVSHHLLFFQSIFSKKQLSTLSLGKKRVEEIEDLIKGDDRGHNFNFSNLAIHFKEHYCTSLQ